MEEKEIAAQKVICMDEIKYLYAPHKFIQWMNWTRQCEECCGGTDGQ